MSQKFWVKKIVNKIDGTLEFLKKKFGYEFFSCMWNFNLSNVIVLTLIIMTWGLPVQLI